MQIILKPEQEEFVLEKLNQGKYQSVDELLAAAFNFLQERDYKEKKLMELRQELAEGKQQIIDGDFMDGELVFQQLQEKLNQMEES